MSDPEVIEVPEPSQAEIVADLVKKCAVVRGNTPFWTKEAQIDAYVEAKRALIEEKYKEVLAGHRATGLTLEVAKIHADAWKSGVSKSWDNYLVDQKDALKTGRLDPSRR